MTPDEVKALAERLDDATKAFAKEGTRDYVEDNGMRPFLMLAAGLTEEAATALLSLSREIEELRAQLAQAYDALPYVEWMDPPDGGSPTLAEQISNGVRAWRDAKAQLAQAVEALRAWQQWWELPAEQKRPDVAARLHRRGAAALTERQP